MADGPFSSCFQYTTVKLQSTKHVRVENSSFWFKLSMISCQSCNLSKNYRVLLIITDNLIHFEFYFQIIYVIQVTNSVKSRINIKNLQSKTFEIRFSFLSEGQNALFGSFCCKHWVKSRLFKIQALS
jgi:hypothetical protein